MLSIKVCILRKLLRSLPMDYIEDAFYREALLQRNKERSEQLWGMIAKLWYRHPTNKDLRKLRRRLYDKTDSQEPGRSS